MDPLSDLLRVVRLDGAYFYEVAAADPWSVEAVAARELSPRIMPSADHLISYHILLEGRCFGGIVGEEQVEMTAGDVIVFPHGEAHTMSSSRGLPSDVLRSPSGRYPEPVAMGEGTPTSQLVCGFLGCDRRPFNPLLASLPRTMLMKGMSNAWLNGFARQVSEESRRGRAGSEEVLTRLAEVMFIEVLRRYLDELPAGQTGWMAGLKDEVVGRVLRLIHSEPRRDWTLPELAREAASSRTSLSKRFTELVGQPPMQYLALWRMQVAAGLLTRSGDKVASIARDVGYDSEAAFSRAFKKSTGVAPGAWRESRRTAAA
jgi:AraC-like DNA-binding protein